MTDEKEILETFHKNKDDGFRMLMQSYQESVYFFIRRMVVVHDDAEDVMQDVFIRIFRSLDNFRSESRLSTWIFKIATNECLRFLKRQRDDTISAEQAQTEILSKLRSSEYVDYDDGMAVKFQEAILQLPETQQIVFNLRYYEEMDYAEISKITGTSEGSLKTSFHYAKDKIKNYILNS